MSGIRSGLKLVHCVVVFALSDVLAWRSFDVVASKADAGTGRTGGNSSQQVDLGSGNVGSAQALQPLAFGWVAGLVGFDMYSDVTFKVGNEKLIKVLPNASDRLRGLLKKQGREDFGALRVKVVGGGCSGLQYKMDLVDGPANRDILVTSNEVRVVIDPKSALFVTGSELDYSDDLQSGGFKVKNPNAVVTCSCGESFAA
jgi:iron-sulfur cluster assembly accessory protein